MTHESWHIFVCTSDSDTELAYQIDKHATSSHFSAHNEYHILSFVAKYAEFPTCILLLLYILAAHIVNIGKSFKTAVS